MYGGHPAMQNPKIDENVSKRRSREAGGGRAGRDKRSLPVGDLS